jgi:hypothetical protein
MEQDQHLNDSKSVLAGRQCRQQTDLTIFPLLSLSEA